MDKVYLYNTMTRQKEELVPIYKGEVRMYGCGPTVYSNPTIGNMRAYIFDDLLRRTLKFAGYRVKEGMNITDVGHLVGDGDEGEDKLEVGAKREQTDPLTIARKYEEQFFKDLKELNILMPDEVVRATETIEEQIEIIKILEEKGFIYKDEFGIYFDTSKLDDYGKLTGQKLEEKKVGVRETVVVDKSKKNPQDFVLWFFLAGRYENHILHWPSPWGEGFPGWHIECSAISRKILGQPFDIHMGGVDHIGTHHTNEIAQSEAAFGTELAKVWMHNEYLIVDGQKMSKSLGNVYTVYDLEKKGFDPIDFRYLVLAAHYRSKLNFTWQALESAHATLKKIRALKDKPSGLDNREEVIEQVKAALFDDLDMPKALAILHEANDYLIWKHFDGIFALNLDQEIEIPAHIQELAKERDEARAKKEWGRADEIRREIEDNGFVLEDSDTGVRIIKK